MIHAVLVVFTTLPFVAEETSFFLSGPTLPFSYQESTSIFTKQIISDPWFGKDKFLHASISAALPGVFHYVTYNQFSTDEKISTISALSVTALFGLAKEYYDMKKKKYFSWRDLVWDGAGLAAGYFAFIHKY